MRRGGSLVKLRGKTYYENFTVNGVRHRGSLHTDSLETAEIIATKRKSDALLAHLIGKQPERPVGFFSVVEHARAAA